MNISGKIRKSFGVAGLLLGLVPLVAAAEQPAFFVDYVLASSTNHYIDTGLVNSGNYKADLTFLVDSVGTKTGLLGCSNRMFAYINSSSYFGIYYNNTAKTLKDSADVSVTVSKNTKYRMVSDLAAGKQTISVVKVTTGEAVASHSGTVSNYADAQTPLYLLNYYNETTKAAHTKVSTVRLYGCKLWRQLKTESESTLVRDFRPAVSQDGRAGLWEAVEEKMYYPPSGEALSFGSDTVCTWTGNGADAKWSTVENWDVMPTTNRPVRLVFQPGDGTLTTENDIEGLKIDNIAVIGTNGTFNLTGDRKLTIYTSGTALSTVHSNLTLNVSTPFDFKTDAAFKYRGDATFAGDFTFADGTSFSVNPTWSSNDTYTTTFQGDFCGPLAKVELCAGGNTGRTSSFKFMRAASVAEMTLGYSYLNNKVYFYAPGNTIGKLNVTAHSVYFKTENPLTPGTVVNWFVCEGYNRPGSIFFSPSGGNTVLLDRIMGENGPAAVKAREHPENANKMTTEKTSINTTLYLRGTADASCYALCTAGLSLVWDPTGDFTQEFRDRVHFLDGTITVKGGTFRSGGTNTFPKVSKVIICDGARFEAESVMPFTSGAVDLEIQGSGKLVLPAGTNCTFKSVMVDEVPVRGANYVGVGCGGEGTEEVPWLEGGAVITAPEVHATFWKAAADGDWGTAENWSDGLPSASLPGYVSAKGGDYTVTVKATDAAPGYLKIVNTGTGTATVKMEGEVTAWAGIDCEIVRGGCVEVPEGATLACDDSSAKFTVRGGTFLVSGGLATFDGVATNNFTGAFSVTGDATYTGVVAVTAGALRYGPRKADNRLKVLEYGRVDVSGTGALKASCCSNTDGPLTLDGGAFNVSGNGLYTTDETSRTFRAQFGSGETVFAGESTLFLNETPSKGVAKFYVTPSRADETATVTFRDAARFALSQNGACDGLGIGDTANATGVLVMASSARHLSGTQTLSLRFTVGSVSKSAGIVRVEDGYFPAAGYRGLLVGGSPRGKWGSVVTNVFGALSVSGGCLYLEGRSTDSDEAYMGGLVVGDASNVIDSGKTSTPYADTDRLAEGLLELSGTGIITNKSGVTMIGGGRGTALFRQTGGTYEQCSKEEKSPFVVGNAGGFGTYLLSGGVARLRKDMYIGGTFTNRLASGGYMATYGYPVNCHTATGVVQVTGGALSVAGDLNLGWDGRGSLEIAGKEGEVSVAGDLVLSNTVVSAEVSTGSALKFTCDENGVSPVTVGGKLVNTSGTKMTVDLSAYDEKRGSVRVLRYGALEGPEPQVELVGAPSPDVYVKFSDTGCRVVIPRGTVLLVR